MREIKFRAWDKYDNKIRLVKSVNYADDGFAKTILVHLVGGINGGYVHGESCELMQFTGLTDRNGKEICEGDIVFTPAWERKGEVLFKDGMFKFVDIESSNGWKVSLITVTSGLNCCEIIGNKYANPELVSA